MLLSAIGVYAIATTILCFVAVFGYLTQSIELIQVSSKLRNLQRSNESMVRTCGGYPDPAYVCYGSANKVKLENMLEGRL